MYIVIVMPLLVLEKRVKIIVSANEAWFISHRYKLVDCDIYVSFIFGF